MPSFVEKTIFNSEPKWAVVSNFKSLNRVVEDSGLSKSSNNYCGHYYQIHRKEVYQLNGIERFFRKVIALAGLTFSGGLLWLYKPVRDLWSKDHLSRRYGKPLENETTVFMSNNRLYYKNPQLLTGSFDVEGQSIYLATVQRGGELNLTAITGSDEKFEISSVDIYKATLELAKTDFDSFKQFFSQLTNPDLFFEYLFEEVGEDSKRFFEFDSETACKMFDLLIDQNYELNTNNLIKVLDWARKENPELTEKLEETYPQYKEASDPEEILPVEVMQNIFSYLKLAEIPGVCSVSKNWNHLVSSNLLKELIYREQAITHEKWIELIGNPSFFKDRKAEMPFPNSLVEKYLTFKRAGEDIPDRGLLGNDPFKVALRAEKKILTEEIRRGSKDLLCVSSIDPEDDWKQGWQLMPRYIVERKIHKHQAAMAF